MATKDACLKLAEALTRASDTAQAAGLYVGYHAHGGDFKKIDGDRTSWDVLFDHTPKAFIHQIDLGNCLGGGGDPYAMIARYPGRSLSVHLKEHGGPKGAVFGQGTVDFKRALTLCEQVGGTTCYVIEQSDPEHASGGRQEVLDYGIAAAPRAQRGEWLWFLARCPRSAGRDERCSSGGVNAAHRTAAHRTAAHRTPPRFDANIPWPEGPPQKNGRAACLRLHAPIRVTYSNM